MTDLTDKEKEVFDKFIKEPVSIVTVPNGWVLKFNEESLEKLLEAAQKNENGQAIVFVKSPEGRGN